MGVLKKLTVKQTNGLWRHRGEVMARKSGILYIVKGSFSGKEHFKALFTYNVKVTVIINGDSNGVKKGSGPIRPVLRPVSRAL